MLVKIEDKCMPEKKISLDDKNQMLEDMIDATEQAILDRVRELSYVQKTIPEVSHDDFFWIIKKIEEQDCSPLLKYATHEQWQYVLDLEIWDDEHIDWKLFSWWIEKFSQADPVKLAKWMIAEGRLLSLLFFYNKTEIEHKPNTCDSIEPDDGYSSFDGVNYVKSKDPDQKNLVTRLLKSIADEGPEYFTKTISGLEEIDPVETERKLYLSKNTRNKEQGVLPAEEAKEIYEYVTLGTETLISSEECTTFEEKFPINAPVIPFHQSKGQNMLTMVMLECENTALFDRLGMEFAVVCNKIMSADKIRPKTIDDLGRVSRKVTGYINIALQSCFGMDVGKAKQFMEKMPLEKAFQFGYSLILTLKSESLEWYNNSWFNQHDLDLTFWGETWGESIRGFMENKPGFYVGFKQENDENGEAGVVYDEFQRLAELDACRKIIGRLKVSDKLLSELSKKYSMEKELCNDSSLHFNKLLFNVWSKKILDLPDEFSRISSDQARTFFGILRSGERGAPYAMSKFRNSFIENFMNIVPGLNQPEMDILKDTLSVVWQDFREEYEWISNMELDDKFSVFLWIG